MKGMKQIIGMIVLGGGTLMAAVRPAGIFTDYAVLQQGVPVRVWGTASPGETVTVRFSGQTATAIAQDDGRWMAELTPMSVSSEGRPLVLEGSETPVPVELKEVLVGEVWLAGGQSNMATTMFNYRETTQADIDRAGDPLMRICTVPKKVYEGENDLKPQWQKSSPGTVKDFSAAAYYFAVNLRTALNVPVGVITCSAGGTPAEAWMSRETLEGNAELKCVIQAYEKGYVKMFRSEDEYLAEDAKYQTAFKKWVRKRAANPSVAGPRPAQKMGPHHFQRPCGLHETMLMQTIPYTLRGVIFYQGENNAVAPAGAHYRTVFPALIDEWRKEFRNSDLPFLFVQLATYGPASAGTPYWAELRDSQNWVENHVKNTGMAVLVDGGEEDNIHPHSKDKAGCRLSLLACNIVYGETNLVCRGPRFGEMDQKDGAIELSFKDIGSGLVLKPEAVSAFEICGKDGKYVPAKAELVEGKVVVSAEGINRPQHIRYGWKQWFVPTLFNSEGLPASPFRTDDFLLTTAGRYYLDQL